VHGASNNFSLSENFNPDRRSVVAEESIGKSESALSPIVVGRILHQNVHIQIVDHHNLISDLQSTFDMR